MAQLYYKLIKAGVKTILVVPIKYQAQVQALLDAE
jgi:hypothetical protein